MFRYQLNIQKHTDFCTCHIIFVGRDSSVGIATRYRLDSPGIESRWRRGFPHPSIPALGPTQPPIIWVPALSRWAKRSRHGVDNPPPTSAEVKERELYLYSTSSWPVVIGRPLPLPPTFKINEFCILTIKCRHVSVALKGSNRLTFVMET